ncbi:unnamed protein product [Oppiella nova]|uniref:RING-type domain-containing protein n=1 Tax=Oppiella nova TaxID=334625 RepID=A0A7R9QRD1_9ACAR|nr:unnamed protein product [Oppiella nova]CAG2172590.1 unnamed protein product [Oppiella nova]
MPGYESERFVGLTKEDRDDLTCSICHNIFREPVVAQCCRQTFCRECIIDWLQHNAVCPFDRRPLNVGSLSSPARAFENIMGKLQIKCEYRDNGCPDVVPLEQLAQHVQHCPHNMCAQCHCIRNAGHDCVQSLLDVNRRANRQIESLHDQLASQCCCLVRWCRGNRDSYRRTSFSSNASIN